jgi:hypothetical protein
MFGAKKIILMCASKDLEISLKNILSFILEIGFAFYW